MQKRGVVWALGATSAFVIGCAEDAAREAQPQALGRACDPEQGGNPPAGIPAGATTIAIEADEVWDPFGVLTGTPAGALLDPGVTHCPGHEPTGNPAMPCPEGSRLHGRGFTFLTEVTVDAAFASYAELIDGEVIVTLDFNWSPQGEGPGRGTYLLTLDAGGTWVGTWRGYREARDDHWVELLELFGCGVGGAVDGMQLRHTAEYVSYQLVPLGFFAHHDATIVVP